MRKQLTRKLFVESLENRRLLAGDVSVSRSGDNLYVTGDNLANTISIESDGHGGARVFGFNDASGQATRINGVPNGSFRAENFSGNIFVAMNGGDDVVRITRLETRTVNVNLGEGNDELIAGLQATGETRFGTSLSQRLKMSESFVVIGAGGDDYVRLQSLYIGGSSVIDTGSGNDTIELLPGVDGARWEDTAERIVVGGALTIVPGNDADIVYAKAVSTGANLVIDDAGGPLLATLNSTRSNGSTLIFGSPQNDDIQINNARANALMQIITEGGDDRVALRDVYAGQLIIDTGAGSDRVSLDNVRTPRADVQLGADFDRLALRGVDIGLLFAFGNTGDDFFDFRGSRIGEANIFGDSGYDTFITDLLAPNTIGTLNLYSIERQQQL